MHAYTTITPHNQTHITHDRAWFTAALQPYNTPAQVYTDFDVGFSVEFELTANSGDSTSISVLPEANDAFGESLFMDNDLVVTGMCICIYIICMAYIHMS
jgi:hypothetical protein